MQTPSPDLIAQLKARFLDPVWWNEQNENKNGGHEYFDPATGTAFIPQYEYAPSSGYEGAGGPPIGVSGFTAYDGKAARDARDPSLLNGSQYLTLDANGNTIGANNWDADEFHKRTFANDILPALAIMFGGPMVGAAATAAAAAGAGAGAAGGAAGAGGAGGAAGAAEAAGAAGGLETASAGFGPAFEAAVANGTWTLPEYAAGYGSLGTGLEGLGAMETASPGFGPEFEQAVANGTWQMPAYAPGYGTLPLEGVPPPVNPSGSPGSSAPWSNLLPKDATSLIGPALTAVTALTGNKGADTSIADQERTAEEQRQAKVQAAIDAINKQFGYGDDATATANKAARNSMYSDISGAVHDTAMRDLDKQFTTASKRNTFGLARSGLMGGSVDAESGSDLSQRYGEGQLKATQSGQQSASDLRASDEKSRQGLIGMAQAGLDTGTAGSLAASQMAADADTAKGNATGASVGRLFDDMSQAYVTNQVLKTRYPGAPMATPSGYGTSVFSPKRYTGTVQG